ncbi:MAG: hypothetical protein ACJ0Q2_00090 [Candidatus Azotimanducaceae bacterium]
MRSNTKLWLSDGVFNGVKEYQKEAEEEPPSAVDDAALIILESKRKEAFVRKHAPIERNSSVSALTISVTAILLLVALRAILIYLL